VETVRRLVASVAEEVEAAEVEAVEGEAAEAPVGTHPETVLNMPANATFLPGKTS